MIPMEFLGIGGGEFLLLVVLAVILVGPEKLPELSRRATRVVYFVRVFANQATEQLKSELGPEYQDLTLADLNPKAFVRKTLLADIEGDLDDVKKELDGVKTDLAGSAADVNRAADKAKRLAGISSGKAAVGANSVAGANAAAKTTGDPESTDDTEMVPATGRQVVWDCEAT